jgi:serine/threonine protein kinase
VVQGSSDSAAGVREGDILAGKYRVERVLGRGGMGVIVAAHHIQLDEKVALKFLLPEALGDAEAVARFAREARNAVKIKSEHVARVIDVGTLPNGAPYMVMEYLDGGDLAAWIKQRGALPIEQAIEFVLQACVAVAEAHALGIVHRDLKPANLFCIRRADGQLSIKVLDFGISKLTERIGPVQGTMTAQGMAFTKTSVLMGSPLYMSPEQMRSSKDVDAQTDIWALGVILFELITGRAPFHADSVTELAIKVNSEPTPALRSLRPDVPSGLQAIVFKCMEKDRRQRYRNVAEMALALLPFAPKRAKASVERISGIIQSAGLSASALAVPPSPQTAGTQASSGTLPPLGRTTIGRKGRRRTLAGAGLAAGLATLSALVLLRRPLPFRGSAPVPIAAGSLIPAVSPRARPIDSPSAAETTPADVAPSASTPQASMPILPIPTAATSAKGTKPSISNAAPVRTAAVTAVTTPAPAVNCKPPYYFDARGNRVFKPECL